MSMQRTLVTMIVEWNNAETTDPRKWDWNAIVADAHNGEQVKMVSTHRLDGSMDDDDERALMESLDAEVYDMIGDHRSSLWDDNNDL